MSSLKCRVVRTGGRGRNGFVDDVFAGVEPHTAAFDTFITAMSIAYGLMVSTLVLPRRAQAHRAD